MEKPIFPTIKAPSSRHEMSRRLYVVRHASPTIDEEKPPRAWQLSEQGRREAYELGHRVGLGPVRIWTSDEPKAVETASIMASLSGGPTAVHAGLREVSFAARILPQAEFRERVGAYLDGTADPAFEPYDEARHRVTRCLEEIMDVEEGDIALVSHGRIITVLLGAILDRRLGSRLWARIGMPDFTVLDLERRVALGGFAQGL